MKSKKNMTAMHNPGATKILAMDLPTEELNFYGVFQGLKPADRNRLYPFLSNLDLSMIDYFTLNDLCQRGDCRGDAAFIFVLAHLLYAVKQGSLCIDINADNTFKTGGDPKTTGIFTKAFLDNYTSGQYKNVVTESSRINFKPIVIEDAHDGSLLLYFQKYFHHENRLKDRIGEFLKVKTSGPVSSFTPDAIVEEIYAGHRVIRTGESKSPILRDDAQVRAIEQCVLKNFVIISGGPGTGKTSLMVNILRSLSRTLKAPDKIMLAAPTGRAAQRMTEAVSTGLGSIQQPSSEDMTVSKLKGNTLHRLLKYRSDTNDFYHGQHHPLDACAVIVDEVSMIDVIMLDKLLQAIDPEKTKLILIGDKDQLPSVEAGAVFSEMTPKSRQNSRFSANTVILKTVYRSGDLLNKFADQINKGTQREIRTISFSNALSMKKDSWAFVKNADHLDWKRDLKDWTRHAYLNPDHKANYARLILETERLLSHRSLDHPETMDHLNKVFGFIKKARILTLVKNGLFGSGFINAVISAILSSIISEKTKSNPGADNRAFSGQIIMITRNDYEKSLFNGDVGVVIKDRKSRLAFAVFKNSEAYHLYHISALPSWEPAFAMTVHKSQGSEFEDVLLVLPDHKNARLLSREMMYTGVTRAKERVIIYGKPDVFQHALDNKIVRQSGFKW